MNRLIKTAILLLGLSLTALYAHGNHSKSPSAPVKEENSKKSIKNTAKQEVKRLALAKKIDKSWLFSPISKMKRTKYNYNNEWVVSFKNPEIKDPSKQTLYVFVTVYGQLTGANYTGK